MKFWDIEIGAAFKWGAREFIKVSEHAGRNLETDEQHYFGHDIDVEPSAA